MNKNGNELTVTIEGRLDTLTAPQLEQKLDPALADVNKLIFDLTELEYISSAGLRVLLASRQKMEGKDGMTVKNVNDDIMEVFEITGFADILDIE
jgi:anti-sigma B factor antagonist